MTATIEVEPMNRVFHFILLFFGGLLTLAININITFTRI